MTLWTPNMAHAAVTPQTHQGEITSSSSRSRGRRVRRCTPVMRRPDLSVNTDADAHAHTLHAPNYDHTQFPSVHFKNFLETKRPIFSYSIARNGFNNFRNSESSSRPSSPRRNNWMHRQYWKWLKRQDLALSACFRILRFVTRI